MDDISVKLKDIYADIDCEYLYNIRNDFLKTYGPDVLWALSGEDLAKHFFADDKVAAKEGICLGMFSWLEFGDRTKGVKKRTLGGVSGGKQFGIKLKLDGYFDYSSSKSTVKITLDEAINKAEDVRDVILTVCNNIKDSPCSNQRDYELLSDQISQIVASKKSKCYWSYGKELYSILIKYFHIVYPDKIAEYYNHYFLMRAARLLGISLPDKIAFIKNGILMLRMKEIIPSADSIRFTQALNIYEQKYADYFIREQEYNDYLYSVKNLSKATIGALIKEITTKWQMYGNAEIFTPFDIGQAAEFLQYNNAVQQRDAKDLTKKSFQFYYDFLCEKEEKTPDMENNNFTNMNIGSTLAKNIILYGPPGTGKTYNTVMRAVEIIDGKDKWKEKDYCEIKARYDELLRENRIAFVTFHQSYGYEEFIEGIKPQTTDDGVTYEVQAGAFKEFCDRARVPIIDNGNLGINTTPTIWKVSLEGTYDNPTRKECLQNNHIRVGFDSYGKDVTSDTDFSVEGGKNVLNAFIGGMRIGDIVLSCYTNTTIDAIGVITGDYEWHDEFDKFKRVRNVRWIFKGKKDITDINGGKTFTLSTVYRLNDMSLSDVLNIVNGNDNLVKNAATTSNNTEKNKYVFIIDEINRGNISKIFGELITLIEENKREGAKEATSAKLPYSKTNFSVPDNVYIIGTMNTADRSIAAIDTALRRRFKFEEMMPKSDIIKCKDIDGIDIPQMLDAINERIEVLYDREHMIGHAYFMSLEENATIAELADIFRNKIIPLLQEYFYEDYDKICLVLGDNQKKEEYRFIKSEDIAYDKLFGSASDIGFGEKNKKFTINDAAFLKKEAYIGIYAPTNE